MRDQLEKLIGQMLDGHILLPEALAEFERIYIEKALERNGSHLNKTAEILGIHRNTLSKRVNSYLAPKRIKKTARKRAKAARMS